MIDPRFHLRRGLPDDATALAAFAARAFEATYGAQNEPADLAGYLAESFGPKLQAAELRDPDVVTLLAEAGNRLAGYAQVRRNPIPEGIVASEPVELRRFYVDRPWQGSGLAGLLMDDVLRGARELGGRSVWLSVWQQNPRAVRFYEKCGFRCAGTATFQMGQEAQDDFVMLWQANPS